MKQGRLIAIEGPDGSGKSTLAKLLEAELSKERNVLLVREPGGTDLGETIREILKSDISVKIDDRAEALLFLAARAQIFSQVILPALEKGDWVIVDRGIHSTMIYQGMGRQLGVEKMRSLSLFATDDVQADLVLALQVSEETAAQRMKDRGEAQDRIEQAGDDFWQRVRRGYLRLHSFDPERVHEIDAEGTQFEALAQALEVIKANV